MGGSRNPDRLAQRARATESARDDPGNIAWLRDFDDQISTCIAHIDQAIRHLNRTNEFEAMTLLGIAAAWMDTGDRDEQRAAIVALRRAGGWLTVDLNLADLRPFPKHYFRG